MTITILKWDEYNPRKDLKSTTWVRLQNSLFENPDFFDFSHAELLTWIYILSCASKKMCGTIRLNFEHAERIGRLKRKDIESALKKLVLLQCVRATEDDSYADVTRTSRANHATNERTNEHPDHVADVTGYPEIYQAVWETLKARRVPSTVVEKWVTTFPDAPWVIHEVREAELWEITNKALKKNFGRFATNWLARGWDRRKVSSFGASGINTVPITLEDSA